jgi:hypothetical protein
MCAYTRDILESKYILPELYRPRTAEEAKPQQQAPQPKPKKQKKEAPVTAPAPQSDQTYWDDAANTPVDSDWLTNQCTVFIAQENSPFAPQELAASIFRELKSNKPGIVNL